MVGAGDEDVAGLQRAVGRRIEDVLTVGAGAHREDDDAGALLQPQLAERPPDRRRPHRHFLHAHGARLAQHRVQHGDDVRPEHLRGQPQGADGLARHDGVGAGPQQLGPRLLGADA